MFSLDCRYNISISLVIITWPAFLQLHLLEPLWRPFLKSLCHYSHCWYLVCATQGSLKYLHWSHSYEALALLEVILDELQIDSMQLSANNISDHTFLAATYARHIDLSENQMSSFNMSAYPRLASTHSLKLTSNLINALRARTFCETAGQGDLDISDNHLDELINLLWTRNILALPNLTILDVSSETSCCCHQNYSLYIIVFLICIYPLTWNIYYNSWWSYQQRLAPSGIVLPYGCISSCKDRIR